MTQNLNGMSKVAKNIAPQFPLYIPSKGRYEFMITSKALTAMKVMHYVIAEPDEVDLYQKAIKDFSLSAVVLPLDMRYKENYELCDEHGLSKSTGPGAARNFAWDHSISNGFDWHWVMDDNIKYFKRLNNNVKIKCETAYFWRVMEDFVLRYKNVGMAGPNYDFFAPQGSPLPPFIINTRIYSCNLIRNDVPYRWRGRYNEDTILSLDMLKAKWCTIQFNAFLQTKMQTQTLKGGNTEEFYHKEGKAEIGRRYADKGTLAKSVMLEEVHPDVAKVNMKYGRIHHTVNYNVFKKLKPVKRDATAQNKNAYNNMGMKLVTVSK